MNERREKVEINVWRKENQRGKKKRMGLAVLRAEESLWSLKKTKQECVSVEQIKTFIVE